MKPPNRAVQGAARRPCWLHGQEVERSNVRFRWLQTCRIYKELAALSTTVALFRRLERATAIPSPTRLATVAERTVITLRTSVKGH